MVGVGVGVLCVVGGGGQGGGGGLGVGVGVAVGGQVAVVGWAWRGCVGGGVEKMLGVAGY